MKNLESAKRKPGRPRSFDADQVLGAAMNVFWRQGFAETSLDDLTQAMGINRPSLYATFGDKQTLYLRALRRFYDDMNLKADAVMKGAPTVQAGLRAFLHGAVTVYTSGDDGPKGCFLVCTASSPSRMDPKIEAALSNTIATIDRQMRRALDRAQTQGELTQDAHLATLAHVLSNTLQSLAIRARAGVAAAELQHIADETVDMVFASKVCETAS
jgi:TetR/AcrR family transcriptional regulator, copper-responsive repressor